MAKIILERDTLLVACQPNGFRVEKYPNPQTSESVELNYAEFIGNLFFKYESEFTRAFTNVFALNPSSCDILVTSQAQDKILEIMYFNRDDT